MKIPRFGRNSLHGGENYAKGWGFLFTKTKRPFYLVLHIMIVNTNLTRD
jgi:hypothetical protein